MRDRVIVPDVVGLPFHVGRDLALEAGVTLANPDPDGPPIAGLAWPGLFYITWQRPSPGTEAEQWDSVVVGIVRHDDGGSSVPARAPDAPPRDGSHAVPESDASVDDLDARRERT